MKALLALLAGIVATLGIAFGEADTAGETAIRRAPPAPKLPAAGGKLTDPTFGTEILRVTDRGDGDQASHAYSLWSPFNADSTRFVIDTSKNGWTLFDFDPVRFTSRRVGTICCPSGGTGLQIETAQWHPTNPDILYALEPSPDRRRLYAYNVETRRYALVHDFTDEVARGGYVNALAMSQDGRYFAYYASRTGGQDTGEIAVAYDRQKDAVYTYDFGAKRNIKSIHSVFIDKSGTYVLVQTGRQGQDKPFLWVWNFSAGTIEPLLWNEADRPGGHGVLGSGVLVNVDIWDGGRQLIRSLGTPHVWKTVLAEPRKKGLANWQVDSHYSWNHADQRFFIWSTYTAASVTGWQRHEGAIYKLPKFMEASVGRLPPETVRDNGIDLVEAPAMPKAAGQWWYDAAADTLYVWLPGNAAATDAKQVLVPFDWRPFQDEIVQVWTDEPGNLTKVRRLAHHHANWPNTSSYLDGPRASSDRSGKFVMFTSNWGGSGHRDVFILRVPPPETMGAKK